MQWWFILRQELNQAGWWMLASALGWAIGLVMAMTVRGALGWPVAGGISGLLTGVLLMWLLRRPADLTANNQPQPTTVSPPAES